MLTTTLSAIRSHSPCASGWKKLIAALGDYGDETPLALARIVKTNGIADALWALRTQPDDVAKRIAVTFAVACAERVLPIFERKYPHDARPRKAIAAARAWLADPTPENARKAHAAADAAHAANAANAAYAAHAAYATAAAAAAAYAAYATANAAHAAHAAHAAYVTANAAHSAEREWQKARLIQLLEG